MRNQYTLIPNQSFDAYVRRGTLREVLCALIVQPEEAEDMAEEHGVEETPHSMGAFELAGGSKAVSAALQTTAEWTMRQHVADDAILQIAKWNSRLGVWCACQVAREALRYVIPGEERPRIAIETAERWVWVGATTEELRVAYTAARDANYDAADLGDAQADDPSAYATYRASSYAAESASFAVGCASAVDDADDFVREAVYTVHAVASASSSAAEAVYAARTGTSISDPSWIRQNGEERARLREVIANACMTFPR
jgi:hypothetical protein